MPHASLGKDSNDIYLTFKIHVINLKKWPLFSLKHTAYQISSRVMMHLFSNYIYIVFVI